MNSQEYSFQALKDIRNRINEVSYTDIKGVFRSAIDSESDKERLDIIYQMRRDTLADKLLNESHDYFIGRKFENDLVVDDTTTFRHTSQDEMKDDDYNAISYEYSSGGRLDKLLFDLFDCDCSDRDRCSPCCESGPSTALLVFSMITGKFNIKLGLKITRESPLRNTTKREN